MSVTQRMLATIAIALLPAASVSAAPVAGMSLWLDASDLSTFPSIGGGGGVNFWNDKSGNNYNFTSPGVIANKPFRQTAAGFLLPVVHFDGNDTVTRSGTSPFDGSGIYTMFIVFDPGKPSTFGNVIDTSPVGSGRRSVYLDSFGIHLFRGAAGGDIANGNYTSGTPLVFSSLWNGASSGSWIDGLNNVTGTLSTNSSSVSSTTIGGADPGTAETNEYFTGNIAEILIYNSALSIADRQANEQYLIDKWLPEPVSGGLMVLACGTMASRSHRARRSNSKNNRRCFVTTSSARSSSSPFVRSLSACLIVAIAAALLGAPRASSATPIAGMSLWLDATNVDGSNNSTLSNGSSITTWKDLSASNLNVTQATGANQPTLATGVLNAKPVVRFDGINDRLANSAGTPFAVTPQYTAFFVLKAQQPASGEMDFLDSTFGNSAGLFRRDFYMDATGINMFRGGGGGDIANTGYTAGSYIIYAASWNGGVTNGSFSDIYHGLSDPNHVTGTMSSESSSGPTGFTVGEVNTSIPTGFYNGDIAEMLVYNSVLSTSDFNSNITYLDNKWFVEVPEPASLSTLLVCGICAMAWRRRRATASTMVACVIAAFAAALFTGPRASVAAPVAGMSWWLDATNIDGSNNGTLSNNAPISTWKDLSSSAIDVTSGTVNRPTLQTNVLKNNTMPVVRFDGINDYMVNGSASPISGGVYSMFLVVKASKVSGDVFDSYFNVTGGIPSYHALYTDANGIHIFRGGGNGDFYNGGYTSGDYILMTSVWNGASSSITVNDNAVVTTTSGTMSTSTSSPNDIYLGQINGGWGGDIAELLIYNSVLSGAEIQANNDYLGQKWFSVPEPAGAMTLLACGLISLARRRAA